MDGGRVASVFKREVQALVPAILLGMARRNPLEADAEAEPPDGQLAQPVQRVRGGEGHAVVRADGVGEPVLLKRALEDGEGVAFLGGRERLAREQIAAGEVGDRQRIAVPPVAEQELAFVVGAPEAIGGRGPGERRPREASA